MIPCVTFRRVRFFFALATFPANSSLKELFEHSQIDVLLVRRLSSPQGTTEDYRRSLTPFLPATVFFGPLRVRALVRVRWPRTGKFLR